VLLTTPPVFRNKTPCRLVYGYHPFEGVWCFNLQSSPKLLGCPEDGDSKVERVVQLHLPHSWTRQPVRTHSQENDNLPCIFRNFQTLRRSRFYRQQDLPWDTKVTQNLLHRPVLLWKLTVAQRVKKFLTFYAIHRFVVVFLIACHWSLSWARSIQSITSTPLLEDPL